MASYNWDMKNFENSMGKGRDAGDTLHVLAFCSSTLTAASVVLGPQAPRMPVLTLPLLSSLYRRKLEKQRHPALTTALCEGRARHAGPPMLDP